MAPARRTADFNRWRTSLYPLKVDIVGDFAGKALVAIHGESLLTHCLREANVDFNYGLQLLHAVHAVEAFLTKLRDRGCNFHVLWFETEHEKFGALSVDREDTWYKYRLARSVLIEHFACPGNSPSATAFSFSYYSLQSSAFSKYLAENTVHLFLGYDDTEPCDYIQYTPLRMLYAMSTAGYCVGFLNDMEFKSSKAYGRVETPKGNIYPLVVNDLHPAQVKAHKSQKKKIHEDMKRLVQNGLDKSMTAREIVSLHALSRMLEDDPSRKMIDSHRRVAALLVHLVILAHCDLSQRSLRRCSSTHRDFSEVALGLRGGLRSDSDYFIYHFLLNCQESIEDWFDSEFSSLKWDIFDLFDGRLYLAVWDHLGDIRLPRELRNHLDRLGDLLEKESKSDVSGFFPPTLDEGPVEEMRLDNETEPSASLVSSVLPFSHPIVDQYLTKVQLDSAAVPEPQTNPKVFQELTHWHTSKLSLDPKRIPKPRGFMARKKNQMFMADTIAYSASLTGASGKNIEPEIIVACGQNSKSKATAQLSQAKPDTKGKKQQREKSGKKKAQEAAKALKDQKIIGKMAAITSSWKDRCLEFEKEPSLVKRYFKAEKYLSGLSSAYSDDIGAEVSLYICDLLMRIQSAYNIPKSRAHHITAMIWHRATSIAASGVVLTEEAFTLLAGLSASLQIPYMTAPEPALKRQMPFKPVALEGSISPAGTTPVEFQLEFCGPYLERSFDSAADPRVAFKPDAWQRDVLDAIDADKSLFVVAPTSAGKTFISFYAMKKVLQADDDGVLVYVAPTKALVNQIAAEIQARFAKSYYGPGGRAGRSVWAIHTRDYRVNSPLGCQVLVTVPSILQILLLAPVNAQTPTSFSRRVRRIIFDEVHCIGQSEEGIIWEQLLLLAPCPIIALSATVANPLEFKAWLESTQKAKGFELGMVIHNSRYSDLRKFLHAPPVSEWSEFWRLEPVERLEVPGLDAEGGDAEGGDAEGGDADGGDASPFLFVHPVGSMVDRHRDTLNDATLEPRDCLTLWRALMANQADRYPVDPSLAPDQFLPNPVSKSDVVRWEAALKDQLAAWMVDSSSPFEAVRTQLRGQPYASYSAAVQKEEHMTELGGTISRAGRIYVHSRSVSSLVVDLRVRGALPAILFNYDRTSCETILQELLGVLQVAESTYREKSPAWAAKTVAFEEWKKAREAAAHAKAKAGPSKDKGKKTRSSHDGGLDDGDSMADLRRDDAKSREPSAWDMFEPDAPLSIYSFADTTKISKAELEEKLKSLEAIGQQPYLIESLRRGLGIHHAGMNRQYRQVVEMLFRKGYLTVVVATGTLAMGLNMPCKTVVFTGDSVYLTALNYRQASGRSGRRGFDLLGNVVFHNIPPHRALEVMSAKLPDLRGQFPISVTLVLRLFILLHGTDNSAFAADALKSLLTQSRLYLGGPESQMSVVHHLRFSIDYLRRHYLLSATGTPLDFSGLVGHLYYTENAVFAFHALLKEGYFHALCADIARPAKQQTILVELITTLSHLFCRIPCTRYKDADWLDTVVRRSPSTVILPHLPAAAATILRRHNADTLHIFRGYVASYAAQHLADAPDNILPLTKHVVAPTTPGVTMAELLPCRSLPAPAARSPFAALSGFDDTFTSIRDLCGTVRAGVFLEEAAVPYIRTAPAETAGVPWNAYLLDFFKHGDVGALVADNGIKRGDVWFHLKDFELVLATVVASLENFLRPSEGAEGEDGAFGIPGDGGDDEEDDDEQGDSSLPGSKSQVGHPAVVTSKDAEQGGKSNKGKAVLESWEDDDSEEEEEEEALPAAEASPGQHASSSSGDAAPSWAQPGEAGQSLEKVHRAFTMLAAEFGEKFRKTFA
ncbi:hypothetical protein B0T24DRAFT_694358 [Lasiosphaeria ovina]|uniref:Helicase n=1 Tax=Lasiosphaeria ovina TaxID=92902 RepID=A0AAE0KMN8_9PEZI|nr:hypothetical protein B0T24DRAFT_694358 [Lasiosphaeria ovina]